MAVSGEKRWPRMGRNKWPLTPAGVGDSGSLSETVLSATIRKPGNELREARGGLAR
jgi:hypothetical protein